MWNELSMFDCVHWQCYIIFMINLGFDSQSQPQMLYLVCAPVYAVFREWVFNAGVGELGKCGGWVDIFFYTATPFHMGQKINSPSSA